MYHGVVARTNIDIDDDLIERAMERYGLRSKREAVDFALRSIVGRLHTPEEILAFEGMGWSGDLDAIKDNPVREW